MDERVSKKDVEFLDMFLADELTEEGLIELDKKLRDPIFKSYYESRLDQKYSKSLPQVFVDYMPMIIMVLLILIGIYLFLK
jgi:hypothetical protein